MQETYHIHIKKEYAALIIEDLKKMDAVEEIKDINIPQWHLAILDSRIEEYKNNPGSFEDFNSAIDEIEKDL